MGLWKWLTTPSRAQQIAKRADELALVMRQKESALNIPDKKEYLLELGSIYQVAINFLSKEFGLTEQEAQSRISEALSRLR